MKKIQGKQIKPSILLDCMVQGLRYYDSKPGFEIDMEDFGRVADESDTCLICAATAAIQFFLSKTLDTKSVGGRYQRAKCYDMRYLDCARLEETLEDARGGYLEPLFSLCELKRDQATLIETTFFLTTGDWQEQLEHLETCIVELIEKGY